MNYIILGAYIFCLLFIFLFSLGQLHLAFHFLRSGRKQEDPPKLQTFPKVTVQLPIYNEKYVVERLLKAVLALDYPSDCLEIQILDDSTDETAKIVADALKSYAVKNGPAVFHIRRENRVGFKAGALQHGLNLASGEFLAIFDADFLPKPDFLLKTLPYFADQKTGVVQTRWGHVNQNYSLFTQLQAFGLDAHFTIEQVGRSVAGSFINFNGTGGVWRKSCIENAGGWQSDTLTEDLDLSYRAQLKGWKFRYLAKVVSPAELPILMTAIKSQQFRWNKGAAESAKKHLRAVLNSKLSWPGKAHAFFHLLNSSVFLALLLASIMSIPVLAIKQSDPSLNFLFHLGYVFLIGFFAIGFFYYTAHRQLPQKQPFWQVFPIFLVVSMGLSLHNAWAVAEGLLGFRSPFVRTPKFNVLQKQDSWKGNVYVKKRLSLLTMGEGLLSLYFAYGIFYGISVGDMGLLLFHTMLLLGFSTVFYQSVKPN